MQSLYLPEVKTADFEAAQLSEDKEVLWDLFLQPLHEELYRRQDFTFMDDLSDGQQRLRKINLFKDHRRAFAPLWR